MGNPIKNEDRVQRIGEPLRELTSLTPLGELGKRELLRVPARPFISEEQKVIAEYFNAANEIAEQDPSWRPLRPSFGVEQKSNIRKQPQVPNKVAQADPRWLNKVAWPSKDLYARQLELETHSLEVDIMFEAVRVIASQVLGRRIDVKELQFYANFGAPIQTNKQNIAIGLQKPLALTIMLYRQLLAGRIRWSADVGITPDTPLTIENKLIDLTKSGGELDLDPMSVMVNGQEPKELPSVERERKIRKVTL